MRPPPERILIGRCRRSLRSGTHWRRCHREATDIFMMSTATDGETHKAIAAELGVSEQTVYYHIRRALDALARCRDAVPDGS